MMDILNKFRDRLNLEISGNTDAPKLLFIMENRQKGVFTDEDLIELRGYYKGLKVAREILERTISEYGERQNDERFSI